MEKNQPFFARFLEQQLKKEDLKQLKGGDPPHSYTDKFPADFAEGNHGSHPCQQPGASSNPNCP